jgi:hypothetical protein
MAYPCFDNALPLDYYSGKRISPFVIGCTGRESARVVVDADQLSGGATYSVYLMTSIDGREWADLGSATISAATEGDEGTSSLPLCRFVRARVEVSSGEHKLQAHIELR